MGNAKRYSQFFDKIYNEKSSVKIICTSNITSAGANIDYKVNYIALLAEDDIIRDNPLIMFLHLLEKMGITKAWLAGFDGYVKDNADNYYHAYLPFLHYCDDKVILRNDLIKNELQKMASNIKVEFLTPTRYL
jgi:4-hydroxy 2-oxovalerate aldolase